MSTIASEYKNMIIPWWIVLLQGIASLILGILLLIQPGITTLIIVQFIGIYWFVSGIFGIVSIFIDNRMWGWKLFSGIMGIIAGIIIIQHPLWSNVLILSTLAIVLGVQGLLIGITNLIQAFKGAGWGIGILGILSIIFGFMLVINPLMAGFALAWVIGIFAIVGGITAIVMAFRLK